MAFFSYSLPVFPGIFNRRYSMMNKFAKYFAKLSERDSLQTVLKKIQIFRKLGAFPSSWTIFHILSKSKYFIKDSLDNQQVGTYRLRRWPELPKNVLENSVLFWVGTFLPKPAASFGVLRKLLGPPGADLVRSLLSKAAGSSLHFVGFD
jgi:hypothetical protein